MTRHDKWEKCISDAQSLSRSAKKMKDSAVWYITDALELTLFSMMQDDAKDELSVEDEIDLTELLDKLKAYAIVRNKKTTRIAFTAEYEEIMDYLNDMEVIKE